MKIKVVGKKHFNGVSKKTGNAYEANIVYAIHPQAGVEGNFCDAIFLTPEKYPYGSIIVGREYVLEYDKRGFVAVFEPV